MNKLEWIPEMALGIPEIDASHQRFLAKFNAIAAAPDLEFALRFFAMTEEIESGFRQEEALMESADFYDITLHRQQHARLLRALHRAAPDVLNGDFNAARQTLRTLPKWFLFHLASMDKKISVWLHLKTTEMTLDRIVGIQNHGVIRHEGLHRHDTDQPPA